MAHSPTAAGHWAQLATAASVAVAVALIIGKGIAWQASGSVAILGSLADSSIDLLSSLIAFYGVRVARQPADANHRFGHGKAEAVSSLVQLVLISGSAVFVAVEAVRALITPEPLAATGLALGVMTGSLVLTVGLVALQTVAIRRSGSIATESDRAHYVGDILANGGALLAVALTAQFGILWADGVAGLLAAGILGAAVWDIGRRALPQLMDEELGAEAEADLERIIRADPDVRDLHALRTRQAGPTTYIQFHLELDPDLTLRRAHAITERLEVSIRKHIPQADIIIHQDLHGMRERHDEYGQPPSSGTHG